MRLFALLLAALCGAAAAAAPKPGDRIEPFILAARSGGSFDWKPGKVAILSCCAFWCDTWKDQLPRVDKARKALGGLPVDFLTVSVDGRWTDRGQKAAVGRMLSDPGGKWSSRLGIDRVPYTFVIDRSGVVAWASFGTVRSESLIAAVRNALQGQKPSGAVFLTFDDFPSKTGAHELLDLLRAESVPATFFCICSRAVSNASLLRRAVREGHELEIHSWEHDAARPEIQKSAAALKSAAGVAAELYRPPGSERVVTLKGNGLPLKIVDPYDFTRPGAAELTRRVSLQVRPGCVIQLHAGVSDTLAALPEIISNLRKRGYEFKLLRDRG